jgi:hypothetical protein
MGWIKHHTLLSRFNYISGLEYSGHPVRGSEPFLLLIACICFRALTIQ